VHPNSWLLFDKYAKAFFQPHTQVLEIGPAQPSKYQTLVGDDSITWHTIDMHDGPGLTFKSIDEYHFPIPADTYDVVVSGQVLEHVRKPWVWIKEVARVCRPGGNVITISPISWPYHAAPFDCWRAYPEGMRALYDEAGLEVVICTFESLEIPGYRRYIPGRSIALKPLNRRLANQIMGRLGYPIERSYDTITIGKKTRPTP